MKLQSNTTNWAHWIAKILTDLIRFVGRRKTFFHRYGPNKHPGPLLSNCWDATETSRGQKLHLVDKMLQRQNQKVILNDKISVEELQFTMYLLNNNSPGRGGIFSPNVCLTAWGIHKVSRFFFLLIFVIIIKWPMEISNVMRLTYAHASRARWEVHLCCQCRCAVAHALVGVSECNARMMLANSTCARSGACTEQVCVTSWPSLWLT